MKKTHVWSATLLASFALAAACGGGGTDPDGGGGEGGADGSTGGGSTVGSGGGNPSGGNSTDGGAGEGGLGGGGPIVIVPLTCSDDLQNEGETDVDCGGPDCDPCEDDAACGGPSDCQSQVCTDGTCMAPTCGDRVKNGTEECDPGGENEECDENCTFVVCGDGYVNPEAEDCEPDVNLPPWQRCGSKCVYGVDLDGTWRENGVPGGVGPWEILAPSPEGAVPSLQGFHHLGQPAIYDFYLSQKYSIEEGAWSAMLNPTPIYMIWANGAVDSHATWIPRDGAMYRFEFATETWSTPTTTGLPDGSTEDTAATFDGAGYVWYAGGGETLVKYNTAEGTFETFSFTTDFPGFDLYEARMVYDPVSNSILAAGFQNTRFLIFDIEEETFSLGSESPGGSLKDNTCEDRAGGAYVGSATYDVMYRYDIEADEFTPLPPLPTNHDNWSTCVVSEAGYLYFGTDTDYWQFARLRLNHRD